MKNSIKLSVLTLAIASAFSLTVKAQSIPTTGATPASTSTTTGSGIRLSIGPDAGLPIGSFKDKYDWSIGGSIQADFPIIKDQLFITVNGGYQNFFAKDINGIKGQNLELIPAKAGLKYFIIPNFYVQGEAGASFLANKSEVGATKSATFVYAPQVGYLFNLGGKNYLDAGVRYEGNTKFTDAGSSNGFLALRVAYSFGI
jgi:hypothetical protein